jgi:hypothetical protein
MQIMTKFLFTSILATSFLFLTSCGGEKAAAGGADSAKTETKAPESAASIVGKWKLADVVIDTESLPAEMKAKAEDPKMKEKMNEGIKQMVSEGMGYEFAADGTAKATAKGKTEDAKYEYKDNVLTVTDKKGPRALKVVALTATNLEFVLEERGLKMNMKFNKE